MPLNDFRSVFLPYCLRRQEDGRWIVLNREYKPVGFRTSDHVRYEDYPIAVDLKGLTKAKLRKLGAGDDMEVVFLYTDASVPTRSAHAMKEYLEKLRVLAGLRIDPPLR